MISLRGVNWVMYQGIKTFDMQEVKEVVRVLKNGKVAGLDEVTGEIHNNNNNLIFSDAL